VIRRLAETQPATLIPTFLGAHEVPPEYRGDRAAYVRLLCEEMIPAVAKNGLARCCDVFCEPGVFTPAEARAILADAVQRGEGIGVFELARRAPLEIAVVTLTWLGTLVSAPFIRPWRWSRLAWTYLPPVLPILGTFDGVVSCLRTYSQAELKDLVRGLDTYEWEIGDFRGRWSPLQGSYLIGVPRLS